MVAQQLGVPFYCHTIDPDLLEEYGENIYDVSIEKHVLALALNDVLKYYTRTSVTLITDSSSGEIHKKLTHLISSVMYLFFLTVSNQYLETLTEYKNRHVIFKKNYSNSEAIDKLEVVKQETANHAYIIILDPTNYDFLPNIFKAVSFSFSE